MNMSADVPMVSLAIFHLKQACAMIGSRHWRSTSDSCLTLFEAFGTIQMTVPLLFVATAILVVAEPSKQGCAKAGHDHVMLQKSISTKSTAVAKESPIDATASPGSAGSPPDPPESHVAVRLQRRLASDPHAVHRAADAIGAGLKPEHHAHLEALRSNPTVAMLKTESQSSQSPLHRPFFDLMDGLTRYASQSGFYEEIGNYTRGKFRYLSEHGSTGELPETEISMFETRMRDISPHFMIHPGLDAICPITTSTFVFRENSNGASSGFRSEMKHKLENLHTQVMKEVEEAVREMWDAFVASLPGYEASEIRNQLQGVMRELLSMPRVLSQTATGDAAGFEKQLQLMWLLMMQYDLEILIKKLLGGSKCWASGDFRCYAWHRHCTVLEVLDFIVLHTEVNLALAMLEPSWAESLYGRTKRQIGEALAIIDPTAINACKSQVDHAKKDAVDTIIQRKLPFLQAMNQESTCTDGEIYLQIPVDGDGQSACAQIGNGLYDIINSVPIYEGPNYLNMELVGWNVTCRCFQWALVLHYSDKMILAASGRCPLEPCRAEAQLWCTQCHSIQYIDCFFAQLCSFLVPAALPTSSR